MSDCATHTLPDVNLTDHLRGILDQLDESNIELKDCLSMPPAVYTSEEWFEFEKRAIWDREWICVGHIGTIPKPGDYVSITINEDPLLVQRKDGGGVRVMSAVCQHRGHVLGEETGRTRVFTCPFHGWSYDETGKLVTGKILPARAAYGSLERLHLYQHGRQCQAPGAAPETSHEGN